MKTTNEHQMGVLLLCKALCGCQIDALEDIKLNVVGIVYYGSFAVNVIKITKTVKT
jgi:hypothetical protein